MIERLARFCARRRAVVLLTWLAVLVGGSILGGAVKDDWLQQGSLPDVESTRALDTLKREFPRFEGQGSGESAKVVVEAPAGITSVQPYIEGYLAKIAAVPGVAAVASPFAGPGSISADGTIAYADVTFVPDARLKAVAAAIRDAAAPVPAGVRLEYSGFAFYEFELPPSEAFGMVGAIVILLIAFGSVVAAGLPILVALFGIGVALALVNTLTAVLGMPQFTPNIVQMIGIGVGIDYALFIVTRYRDARARKSQEDAVAEAMNTAGRAVLFAGITVVISMLGMVIIGLQFITGMAIGVAASVAVVVVAALTIVPALLAGRVGRNLDRWHVPFFAKGEPVDGHETVWHRWSRFLQGHAWPAAIGGVVVLSVLALPLFSLHMGASDDGNLQTTQTVRRAYDLLAKGFGPGSNGPFIVTAEATGGGAAATADVAALRSAIAATPGVALATPPRPSASGRAVFFSVIPETAPQATATEDLVHRLRDQVVPDTAGAGRLSVHIGGITPANIDFAQLIGGRLPLFMGSVLLLSFLLLMAVFRSILVPLKAVIMNLLSIGAAYGLIVAVFQWGWLSGVFGVGQPGPIEPWIPMMLFAIVFGLSMDYEVFLLSKVREEYDRTGRNSHAVVEGLASTARVITAAAAIMVLVFAGFIPGERQIKMMGLGLAAAVFMDATIVRMILVPATMELLGDRNWWFPRWLDRLIPRLNVEGDDHVVGAAASPAGR